MTATAKAVRLMICEHGVEQFYVGDSGAFDRMAAAVLREWKDTHPQIDYRIVLAYMPSKRDTYSIGKEIDTLLPDGIEGAPRRFAISYRNKWMVTKSDYVTAYAHRSFGGAAQLIELARRQGKVIAELICR